MIKNKFKKILFLSISLSVSLFSFQAKAQLLNSNGKKDLIDNMKDTGKAGDYVVTGDEKDLLLSDVVNTVLSAFLGLLGIIFLIMIIIGGFNWMTAAGNDDKISKAKATLFRGTIGLFIVVAAYVITAFVFRALGGIVGKGY